MVATRAGRAQPNGHTGAGSSQVTFSMAAPRVAPSDIEDRGEPCGARRRPGWSALTPAG